MFVPRSSAASVMQAKRDGVQDVAWKVLVASATMEHQLQALKRVNTILLHVLL